MGNATRGKGGGGRGKSKSKALTAGGNPGPAATSTNKNHKPRGGATYQAIKVTGQAATPLTDYVLIPGGKSVEGLMSHLRERANFDLAKGYAVAAADFGVSKHRFVRHANALSRLSVTAVMPEAYNALKVVEEVQAGRNAREIHRRLGIRTMGYDPTFGTHNLEDPEFRTYHKLKWFGALARLIANRTRFGRAITRPIRENVLRELGASA